MSEAREGLEPGTTYHFRIIATIPVSTVYGEDTAATTRARMAGAASPFFEYLNASGVPQMLIERY